MHVAVECRQHFGQRLISFIGQTWEKMWNSVSVRPTGLLKKNIGIGNQ